MRADQQIVREQVSLQARQQEELAQLMKRLNAFFDRASKN